jgi:hypothetical protein
MEVMALHFYGDYAMFGIVMILLIYLYSGQAIYLSYDMGGTFGKVTMQMVELLCGTWIMLWFKCVDILNALVD